MSLSNSSRVHKEKIIIHSQDKHQFFISKNAVSLCPGLSEMYSNASKNPKGDVEIFMKVEKNILEIFIDFVYFKLRYLSENYEKLPEFEINPDYVLELYELSKKMNI